MAGSGSRKRIWQWTVGVSRTLIKVLRRTIRAVLPDKSLLLALSFIVVISGDIFFDMLSIEARNLVTDDKCEHIGDDLFLNMTETRKMSSAIATNLMTLVPALLVFGPFPTVEIRSIIPYSSLAAFLTSACTLGLATSKMSTMRKNRILKVADLCTPDTIQLYGRNTIQGSGIYQLYSSTIRTIHNTSNDNTVHDHVLPAFRLFSGEPEIYCLRDIMTIALRNGIGPSRSEMGMANLDFIIIQSSILYGLLLVVPRMIQINILWICRGPSSTFVIVCYWIISMFIAGCIGTFANSSWVLGDEILHLSPWTSLTSSMRCDECSLSTILPSTRPHGLVSRFISYLESVLRIVWFNVWARPKVLENLSGVVPLIRKVIASRRTAHAMVVILRPSTDTACPPVKRSTMLFVVLGGLLQALLLVCLTVVFGSTFDNSIMQTMYFIATFISAMVALRTHSIYYCLLMERQVKTIVIEYRTPTEFTAIKAILGGMPFVVVENTTDGSTYYDGYRLDRNPNCPTHPSTSLKTDPIRFARCLVLLLIMMMMYSVYVALNGRTMWTIPQGVKLLFFMAVLFIIFASAISAVISSFNFIDIHGSGIPPVTTTNQPASQP